jgi:hypothetical protein
MFVGVRTPRHGHLEPAVYLIQPRVVLWREVQLKSRPVCHPLPDFLRLVRVVVVDDEVHIHVGRATHFRTFLTQTLPHFSGHVFPRFSGHGCNEGEDVDSRVSVVAKQLLEQRGDGI